MILSQTPLLNHGRDVQGPSSTAREEPAKEEPPQTTFQQRKSGKGGPASCSQSGVSNRPVRPSCA